MNAPSEKTQPRPKADHRLRIALPILLVAAVCAYAATGVFVIQPDQRGVVRRFGRIVERGAPPGVHYALPAPFGRVDKPKTTEIKRAVVGQNPDDRAAIAAGDVVARGQSLKTDVFTGDVNIVKTTLIAQYRITAPDKYLTATADPTRLVKNAVQSVLVETLGAMSVDEALTEGKAVVENVTRTRAQRMLDRYASGITLSSVSLESIEPPFAINDAFKDVASAKKDRERDIDEAHAFADTVVRRARGAAAEILADARGYRDVRIGQARGATQRFGSLLAEYKKAPEVTRVRMVMDTLADIMGRARVFVLSDKGNGPPTRLTITND